MSDKQRVMDEFFKDRAEQLKIEDAFLRAIPDDALLTNVILALSDLLATFTHKLAEEADEEAT